jgi:hypothetical protein
MMFSAAYRPVLEENGIDFSNAIIMKDKFK